MKKSKFFQTLSATGRVWVVLQDKAAYAMRGTEGEIMLPIWSSKQDADQFLLNTRAQERRWAVEVPVDAFKKSWLESESMNVDEIVVEPNGEEAQVLVLTKEEFIQGMLQ